MNGENGINHLPAHRHLDLSRISKSHIQHMTKWPRWTSFSHESALREPPDCHKILLHGRKNVIEEENQSTQTDVCSIRRSERVKKGSDENREKRERKIKRGKRWEEKKKNLVFSSPGSFYTIAKRLRTIPDWLPKRQTILRPSMFECYTNKDTPRGHDVLLQDFHDCFKDPCRPSSSSSVATMCCTGFSVK